MKQASKRERTLDRLTAQDYEIFERARENANWFTDYYFRSPTSGTRWYRKPTPPDAEREEAWQFMFGEYQAAGSPPKVWIYNDTEYNILEDEEGYPIFWQHHGWLWMPWQLEAHHCPQPELTLIGGFGSGKTAYIAMSAAVLAATIPYARIFCVAPQMIQTMEVYNYLITNGTNTPWWNRWVWNSPTKPYPKFVLKSDYIGQSTIELLSIEHDPEKVRTLEGDMIFLDQAEKIEDLDGLIRDLGSRLRGQVQGRARLGKLILVANAGDNPQLWMRYDMAELEPDVYKSLNPSSWDNIFLTKQDLANLRRRVSGGTSENAQEIDQWMGGNRPMGKGKHFPATMVKDCTDPSLDSIMKNALKVVLDAREENEISIRAGHGEVHRLEELPEYAFVERVSPRAGIVQWEMPPDHKGGRQYLVIGDPGQADPPDRNSPPIMVWDITDFPKGPAVLRAFTWVYGKGSYWPFINTYESYVKRYRAQGRNGFDSTGAQTGLDELVFAMQNLHAEGIDLSGNKKFLALNALKMFMGKRLIRFPYISHLVNQLTNYDLPDNKIRQDLVMVLAMTAQYLRRFYYEEITDQDDTGPEVDLFYDRHERRLVDRYARFQER
jgi:hypothetical protein